MWQSSLSPSLPISLWLSVAPVAKADVRVKAAKPDDLVVKVDVVDGPVRVAGAVVDLAKVDRVADDLVVAQVEDVDSASHRPRSKRLSMPTKTA